jgi:hypothetical protein
VGTKVSTTKHKEYKYEFDSLFMPDVKTFQPNKNNFFKDKFKLLNLVFKQAINKNQQVILVLISSLTDIAVYTDTEDGLKIF